MCGRARQSRTRLEAASRENAARRETGIDVSPCAGERLNSPCPWVCRAPPAQAAAGSARPPPRPAPSPAPSGASPGPPRQTAWCKQSVLLPLAVAGSDPPAPAGRAPSLPPAVAQRSPPPFAHMGTLVGAISNESHEENATVFKVRLSAVCLGRRRSYRDSLKRFWLLESSSKMQLFL